jgi:hypothetical protein
VTAIIRPPAATNIPFTNCGETPLNIGHKVQLTAVRKIVFLKKQPGHAEFISASHQDGYPIYRQFIAKHVFYFASEMPICIGMTPHFISSEHLWAAAERRLLINKKNLFTLANRFFLWRN